MKKFKLFYTAIFIIGISFPIKAQLKVTTAGYIGINDLAPSQRLSVSGNAFIESTNRCYFYNTNRYLGIPSPGAGVTGDMLLTSKDATMLRIGSIGAIGFWGNTSGESTSTNYNVSINGYGIGIGSGAGAWSGVNLYIAGNGWVTGTWTVGSDKRFKKNIIPVTGSLDKILKLNGKSYEYNKEEFKDCNFNDGKTFGFIAQDVKEVLPELVSQDNKGYYGVNYIGIIPIVVEAMKEQNKRIDDQNKKISDLETQLSYCCTSKQDAGANAMPNAGQVNNKPSLLQNTPNPFSQQTNIGYYLPTETKSASIMIFDLQGKLIKSIAVTNFGSGSLTISANELNAGMFMYTLIADGKEVDSKRMILTQ